MFNLLNDYLVTVLTSYEGRTKALHDMVLLNIPIRLATMEWTSETLQELHDELLKSTISSAMNSHRLDKYCMDWFRLNTIDSITSFKREEFCKWFGVNV